MRKLNNKGFTLIELLVVIAIIGILASIVLVSLNSARNKGYDTQVKSDMAQVRNLMEICYDNSNGTYDGCVASITAPTNPACGAAYVGDDTATDWAFFGQLCTDAGQAWCADSTGVSKTVALPGAAVTVCP